MIKQIARMVTLSIMIILMFCFLAAAAQTATVTANVLNLRSAPSDNGKILTVIPKGATINVIQVSTTWTKVLYKNKTGHVATRYLKFSSKSTGASTGVIAVTTANVRSSASASGGLVEQLSYGTSVSLLNLENNWYKIRHGSKTGYVRADLISKKAVSKTTSKRTTVVKAAAKYLGVRYVYGGASPKGFDCSGFTAYVFKSTGYNLAHGATSQMRSISVSIPKKNLLPGDLVFFKSSSSRTLAGHVGIYVGNGKMIHASMPGDVVKYDTINSGYYSREYIGARRIIT